MDIKTKDGILLKNVPDGTPEEEIKARLQSIRSGNTHPTDSIPDSERHQFQIKGEHEPLELQKRPDMMTRIKNDAIRHYIGISELLTDPLLLGAHITDRIAGTNSAVSIQSKIDALNKIKDEAKKANRVEGFDFLSKGGKFGTTMLGLGKLKIAQTLWGKGLQGVGIGGYFGAAEYKPEEGQPYSLAEAAESGAYSAAIGGVAAPAAHVGAKGYQAGKHLYRYLTTGDPGSIAARAAGKEAPKVIKALRTSESRIPGAEYTAGQASVKAGSPQFAALEKHVTKERPEILGTAGVRGKQEAARTAAVKKIERAGGGKEAAKAARRKAASPLYQKAEKSQKEVNITPVKREIHNLLIKNANRKSVTTPLNDIKKAFKGDMTVQRMKSLSEDIGDKLKKKNPDGSPEFNETVLRSVKAKLDDQIGLADKNYKAARETFKESSKPVNQAEVGEELLKKLRSPLEEERAGAFVTIAKNYMSKISRDTGKPMLDSLTKEQKKTVFNVIRDLTKDKKLSVMSKEGSRDMMERIQSFELPSTGIFKPILSAARGWFNQATGRITEKGVKELGVLMKPENKKKLADLMEKSSPKQQEELSEMLQAILVRPIAVTSAQVKEE